MKTTIGIDIGGTKISGVLFDGKKVLDSLTIATPKNLFEFKRNVLKLADFLSAKKPVVSIGIGMAGLVNAKKGVVKYSPNIKFVQDLNLVRLFREHGFKKVLIDNDANCFTRAEMVLGQGRGLRNFLGVTLGTGIGGGIVIDRKIYRGRENSGGELGHVFIGEHFLETHFKKFRDVKNFKLAGALLGRAFASLINIFAPDAIIIGGGYGQEQSQKYLPMAKTTMRQFLFNKQSETKILVSKLKNAGALGAALLLK